MKKFYIIAFLLFLFTPLFSQEVLKSTEEEYYDFLALQGLVERPTLGYRTLSDSVWNLDEDTDHVWSNNNLGTNFILWQPSNEADNFFTNGLFQGLKIKVFGPQWFNSYNTDSPYGQNDGALWQGRGYNTSFSTGVRAEAYGFELTLKPNISWMQNQDFEHLPGVSGNIHSYFAGGSIDFVQRYGDTSFFNFDWGESEIRWTWYSLTFGVGTQNPWLGPAYLNPMLGSNNAPGYLKFDAGLRKLPVVIPGINLNLGTIEGRIWTGRLEESDYYDTDETNNTRMLTAMSASYDLSFIPGLTIGLNRVFVTYWRTENFKYLLQLFSPKHLNSLASSGNDEDQKFSLFAVWDFPKVGFNVYGEFGRDDFSSNEGTNPFHTGIYTVGLKKIIPIPLTKLFPNAKNVKDLTSEIIFEWNNFEMSQDFQLQWQYMGYYAHGFVRQGYTHKGQILGAGSGYFGNSQFFAYNLYLPKSKINLFFHRNTPNINYIYNKAVNTDASYGSATTTICVDYYGVYETFFNIGANATYYVTPFLNFNFGFIISHSACYHYIKKNANNNFDFNLSVKLQI